MADDSPTRRIDPDDQPTVRVLAAGRKVFGRYVLEVEVGRGGMGVVWRARDAELEREVALKFLPEVVAGDAEAVRDLKRETRRCLELTHPHIVRVHDFVAEASLAAIAMELIDGQSLARRKAGTPAGCLGVEELAPLVAQLCVALDYAHRAAKVVHRDLKPANILVTKDGVAKITDFGIARSLSDTHTRLTGLVGKTSGTLAYMSPQQLLGGDPSPGDDIYALGATLYELLTGKPPFHTGDLPSQIREVAPKRLNERRAALGLPPVPKAWEETILACLAKEPERRPPNALAIAERLSVGNQEMQPIDPAPLRQAPRAGDLGQSRQSRTAGHDPAPKRPPSVHYPTPAETARAAANAEEVARRAWQYPVGGSRRGWTWMDWVLLVIALSVIGAYVTGYTPFPRPWLANPKENDKGAVPLKSDQVSQPSPAASAGAHGLPVAPPAEARGGIVIHTEPADAEITVSDLAMVKSPATLKDMKPGQYPVVIRLAGFEEATRTVEVKENAFATLDVALTRSTGTAQIASVPPGLEVEVVGRVVPNAPPSRTVKTPAKLGQLPTGDYELTFRREGWPEQKQTLTVVRNHSVSASAEFVGGALEIASSPSGAEVFSQGKRLGVTPLSLTEVIPGSFDLEFHLNGYQSATAHGEVRAKETARAAVVLEKVRGPEGGQAWTVPDLGLTMQPIPAGTFTMGSPASESGRFDDEGPQMHVTITRPFWLGRTEVTQAQWEALMESNPSNFKGSDRSVEKVSWDDAMAFCRSLTEREREAGRLPEGYAYTLPTEAQWEYACRAGTTVPYGGDGNLDDIGWYGGNSGSTTHPVGQKQANAWGLYDMHGNVREWCLDWYGIYPGGSVRDPTGSALVAERVGRGGGWYDGAGNCRSANRAGIAAGFRDSGVGFRLALAPTP